jgi:hypothetical protein
MRIQVPSRVGFVEAFVAEKGVTAPALLIQIKTCVHSVDCG